MPFNEQGYRQAAKQAGIPSSIVEQTIAKNTGTKGWLTGGKAGIGGFMTGVSNVLNLPSYALGGVLNQGQRALGSQYGQKTDATGLGVLEGIKSKRGVFTEAPETLGIDPNSGLGKAVGFGAELLMPSLPVGKLAKVGGLGQKVTGAIGKVGDIGGDAARTLLEKSYKLSASDINKIAESIGVTDESQKAIKVIDYLEALGLQGSTRSSLQTLNKVTEAAQKPFNALARSGGQVSRQPFIDELLSAAIEAEKLDTPASRTLSKKLFAEAYEQSKKGNKPLLDTELTDRISALFGEAGQSAISDPSSANLAKGIAKAGQKARETLRPGTTEMGRKLRGLRTTQEVIGKKANTGLGTQLVNSLKPGVSGFGIGAVTGYSTGQNPLLSGAIGVAGGAVANNPKLMNLAGKALGGGSIPKISPKMAGFIGEAATRIPMTAARTTTMSSPAQESRLNSMQSPQVRQPKSVQAYSGSIPQQKFTAEQFKKPKNVFSNKSAFGKRFALRSGSFN